MIAVEADNYRPASIAFGENVNNVDIYLAPQTAGVAVDESDEPVAGAWISNDPRDFRADGFYQVPDRQLQGRRPLTFAATPLQSGSQRSSGGLR